MSGDPEILACDAAGLSDDGPRKRLLCKADHFLLTHQFAASKRHPERLWRVQKGSVMGDEETQVSYPMQPSLSWSDDGV